MNILPCHFYHMSECNRGENCNFSHAGKPQGICKNKDKCPIAHCEIICPLFLQGDCPNNDSCDFRHVKRQLPYKPKVIKDEEQKEKESKGKKGKDKDKYNNKNKNDYDNQEKKYDNRPKTAVYHDSEQTYNRRRYDQNKYRDNDDDQKQKRPYRKDYKPRSKSPREKIDYVKKEQKSNIEQVPDVQIETPAKEGAHVSTPTPISAQEKEKKSEKETKKSFESKQEEIKKETTKAPQKQNKTLHTWDEDESLPVKKQQQQQIEKKNFNEQQQQQQQQQQVINKKENANVVEEVKQQQQQQNQGGDSLKQEVVDYNKNEFQKRLQDIHQDLLMFKPYEDKINKKTDLDLMFIMDCTGSMGSWIQASKKELQTIIDFVKNEYKDTKIRISYIGYRDHCDGANQFCIQEFTEDVDMIKNFIHNKAMALGGGDTPEDIAGAFEYALKQKWQAKSRYCVLVADAPCHGKKYHDCDDSYPQGDPKNREPQQQIKEFAKKGIQFYAVKITNITNKMFNILSSSYQEIAAKPIGIANLGNSTNAFGFYIACTVSATIGYTVMGTQASVFKRAINLLQEQRKNNEQTSIADKLDQMIEDVEKEQKQEQQQLIQQQKKMIKFDLNDQEFNEQVLSGETYDAKARTFFIVKDKNVKINWRKPLLQDSEITTKISISKQPFAQGAMRYAFYAQDEYLDQKLVTKLPKWIDDTYNIDYMKKDLESIFICQHIVNEFNDKIIPVVPDTRLLLNFVHSFIYEILDKKSPYKYYYAENLIEGQYQKYNNNDGWFNSNVNESSLISQAFSHFSWQTTQGFLMIVDLQGVTGILTDPQIHCLDFTRFGKGNRGYEGILKFFLSHKCNHYCNHLKLLNPKDVGVIPNQFDFFEDVIQKPKDPYSKVYTLCDLCKKPFQLTANQIYYKSIESQEKYCNVCDLERKDSMKEGKCIDCGKKFRSSEYWFKMKRTDFPVRCGECRKARRDRMRKELELGEQK